MRENPAYPDYCDSQGISVHEKNLIILLGTIGKRGPSTFIFEKVYETEFCSEEIKKLREKLDITQHDFSEVFDLSLITLQRIESGNSHDFNTLKRIEILLTFPEVALWQLKQTRGRIHHLVFAKLLKHFQS